MFFVWCIIITRAKLVSGVPGVTNLTNHWTKAAVLLDQKMSAIVALPVFDQFLFATTWLFRVCIYAGGIWCGTKEILSLDLQGSRVSEGSSVWHGPQVDPCDQSAPANQAASHASLSISRSLGCWSSTGTKIQLDTGPETDRQIKSFS